jgi:hypothetical protein
MALRIVSRRRRRVREQGHSHSTSPNIDLVDIEAQFVDAVNVLDFQLA